MQVLWQRKRINVRLSVRYNICERDETMTVISITKARANLYRIVADVNENSQPVTITNSRGKNAVLISESDWNTIRENLYLNTVPGIAKSIMDAKNEPLSECATYVSDEEW